MDFDGRQIVVTGGTGTLGEAAVATFTVAQTEEVVKEGVLADAVAPRSWIRR